MNPYDGMWTDVLNRRIFLDTILMSKPIFTVKMLMKLASDIILISFLYISRDNISMHWFLSTASDGEELKVIDKVRVLRNDKREGKHFLPFQSHFLFVCNTQAHDNTFIAQQSHSFKLFYHFHRICLTTQIGNCQCKGATCTTKGCMYMKVSSEMRQTKEQV